MDSQKLKYFESLGMEKDPFSMESDPVFFYPTGEHMGGLRRLELSLRMNGGINLVLGDSGVGKTMLLKVIHESFGERNNNLILRTVRATGSTSEYQFLRTLCEVLEIGSACRSIPECQNAVHDHLFRKKIEEGIQVVLLIDEGQELTTAEMKVLSGILEFEFDGSQFLHMVIFGGFGLLSRLDKLQKPDGRTGLKYVLNPLDLEELKEVIFHRLKVAGYHRSNELFDDQALHEIWRFSGGNLLKANMICNHSLVSMTIRENRIVGPETVRSVTKQWRNRK